MPLTLTQDFLDGLTIIRFNGRLDAHGASDVEPILEKLDPTRSVLLDFTNLTYLSSAGIRVFIFLQKKLNAQGSCLMMANLQPYCREVLRVAGLDQFFAIFAGVEEAVADARNQLASYVRSCGRFIFDHCSDDAGRIEVLGSIEDVLEARITPEHVRAKRFSAKEYSIGLGGLGPSVEDVLPRMGEMITIGGTMVWLPTDGNDMPDFLVPRHDSDQVMIRTGFNVALAGNFNEYVEFESSENEGTTLHALYGELFDLARQRRPDFRGAIAFAMRAEIGQVYGCGVVKAPIAANAPANGKPIIDPSNFPEWFESDTAPRHRDVTGLICGIGVDRTADLSVFNQPYLKSAFYLNPGNTADQRVQLHQHGVFFKPFPLGEKPWNLEQEIGSVVEEGEFIDMRHLYDRTTIQWALIGVSYIQDFVPDPASPDLSAEA